MKVYFLNLTVTAFLLIEENKEFLEKKNKPEINPKKVSSNVVIM